MGGGIAAHLANLGFDVVLFDLTRDSVQQGFARAQQAKPPHFMTPEVARNVRLASIEEDLHLVRSADWVCEAVVEKLDVKRSLYRLLEPVLRSDAMITTNTSGLQIAMLADDQSDSFRERFMGVHFFNPPRYLKLLELIPTHETDAEAVTAMTRFLEERVARRVVVAKDTPGFIANRFGMWSMYHATVTTERLHLTVEQVDAITGPFLGRPRTGSFRLNDLVGLDIMEDIARNLTERCTDDPHRSIFGESKSIPILMERGWIGDKAGQGFYRREGREFLSLDLGTMAYRHRLEPDIASLRELGKLPLGERIAKTLDARDEAGEFLRNHLVPALQYADALKEDISHSVIDFDRVMQWGFGWELGPFALADAIGREKLGLSPEPSYREGGMRDFKGVYVSIPKDPAFAVVGDFPKLESFESFHLREFGDGVTGIVTSTKLGVFTPTLIRELTAVLRSGKIERFVFTSEGRAFSAGFDLKFVVEMIDKEDFSGLLNALDEFQQLGLALRSVPGAACVFGYCLGGGYEMATSCSVLVAHAEAQIGLPEARAGLVPSGGGAALLRLRHQDTAKDLAHAAAIVAQGFVAPNAEVAKKSGFLREGDRIEFHPDRMLFAAKQAALAASIESLPDWKATPAQAGGILDRELAELHKKQEMTDYDMVVAERVKAVFLRTAGFDEALQAERDAFAELCHRPQTEARMRYVLENGKPLRN